jgi:hypothetical protein
MVDIPDQEYDIFNAPINGQSLTAEPKKWPWDRPPKYADFEQALDMTMEKLFKPEQSEKVLTMLEAGVPVEGIARTVVFSGFMNGQYTPDVGFMMAKNVLEAILTIGVMGKVDNLKVGLGNRDTEDLEFKSSMNQLDLANRLAQKTEQDFEKIEKVEEDKPEQNPAMGLMARTEPKSEIELGTEEEK